MMSLPVGEFLELVDHAREERNKAFMRQQWLAQLPWMTEENKLTFDQYYEQSKVKVSHRPAGEILADAEAIRRAAKSR